jgi:hypothetical protein
LSVAVKCKLFRVVADRESMLMLGQKGHGIHFKVAAVRCQLVKAIVRY